MSRCLIICAVLLSACGPDPIMIHSRPPVPADLLAPAPGWTGLPPSTEGQLIDAAAAEKRGRQMCNGQLLTITDILTPN